MRDVVVGGALLLELCRGGLHYESVHATNRPSHDRRDTSEPDLSRAIAINLPIGTDEG